MAFQILLSVLITSWLSIVYNTIGDLLRKTLSCNNESLLENFIIDTSLGFGIFGFLIMLLNFTGLASPGKIILVCILLTLICIPQWIGALFSIRNFQTLHSLMSHFRTDKSSLLFLLIPTSLLFLYFLRTLLPPSGFDALMYHLSCAQLFLNHGGFYNVFFNQQSDFPMITEMNFMIGLAFNNDLICRQLGFLTECIASGSLILFCRTLALSRKETSLAVSSLLTLTVTIASMTTCDVDFAMTSWIALTVYTLLKASDRRHSGQVIISAIFAGMAMSTKIFGVFVLPLLLFISMYHKKLSLRALIPLFIIPLMIASPWYLKSFLNKGTFLSINKSLIASQGLGLPMGFDPQNQFFHFIINVVLRIIAAPWSFTLFPSQHQEDTLGPLLITLLPFALFVKLPPKSKQLLAISGIYLGCILLMEMFFIPGGASIRYLLILPVLCIPVCISLLKEIQFRHRQLYRFLMLFLVIQISLGTVLLLKRYHRDWIALLTLQDKDNYYSSILPEYPAIRFINSLPEHCTVMSLYNFDNYLIRKNYISAYRHYTSNNDLLEDLKKHSVSYIFANNVLDTSSNVKSLPELDKTIVFSRNGFYIYRVSGYNYYSGN